MVEITEKEVELNNMLYEKITNYLSFLHIGIHNRSIRIDTNRSIRIDTHRSWPPYYHRLNQIVLSVEVEHERTDWYIYDFIHR